MKRSAPLKPGKPLQRSGKRLRSGRSTGTPTKAEAAWIVACKAGPCLACHLRGIPSKGMGIVEAHHLLSGGRRIGHLATVGLCLWHHRAEPFCGHSSAECRSHYGPSLAEGSKTFHAAFGTDDELLQLQNHLIGGSDDAP